MSKIGLIIPEHAPLGRTLYFSLYYYRQDSNFPG